MRLTIQATLPTRASFHYVIHHLHQRTHLFARMPKPYSLHTQTIPPAIKPYYIIRDGTHPERGERPQISDVTHHTFTWTICINPPHRLLRTPKLYSLHITNDS